MRRIALMSALALTSSSAFASGKPGKVKLDLYVMSLCPFGVQAENGIIPAAKALAAYVDLDIHFIADEAPGMGGAPAFSSMHGDAEVREDIRQVCALKLFPNKALDYILERNKGSLHDPQWKAAASAAGLRPAEVAKMEECAGGMQGPALLSKSLEASRARGTGTSPTIDIAGVPYTRGRGQASVTAAVCDALKAAGTAPPPLCAQASFAAADEPVLPAGGCAPAARRPAAKTAPVVFDIRVVTDKDCPYCAPTLLAALAEFHPGARIRTLDAGSEEGRGLIRSHGAKSLPLYVLDAKVEQDANFPHLLAAAYYKSHDAYLIRQGPGNYYPGVQLGRRREPRHLDVFLESLSPSSLQAQQDLVRFLVEEEKGLGDLTFSFHFLVAESPRSDAKASAGKPGAAVRAASLAELAAHAETTLVSPRGDAEIQEDIRQLCLFQHEPIGTLFTYMSCRGRDLADPRQAERCLQPGEAVKRCIDGGEGRELLRQDAKLARELDLSRAPVLLWENRFGPSEFNETDWRGLLRAKERKG